MNFTKRSKAALVWATALAAGLGLTAGAGSSNAAARPASAHPTSLTNFADPGFSMFTTTTGAKRFYLYATGPGFRAAASNTPKASGFAGKGPSMSGQPGWVVDSGDRGLWAPSVFRVKSDGKWLYVMYFVGRDGRTGSPTKGKNCIGIATSASPTGNFRPTSQKAPFLCPRTGMNEAIDPSMFRDTDGKRYLVYKVGNYTTRRFEIRAKPMDSATSLRDAGASFLLTDAAHHDFRGSSQAVIEAPQVIRRGNKLWLFTSRGGYKDCAYSTFAYSSTSIRSGRWNFGSAVMTPGNSTFCGPGGAEVVNDGGTYRIAFHVWKNGIPKSTSADATRQSWVGTLKWDSSGNPHMA
jgi:hypothetical protein